jgi:hypothetical protein
LGPNQTKFAISGNRISHTDIAGWLDKSFQTANIKTDFKLNQQKSKLDIDLQNQRYVFSSLLDNFLIMNFALNNYRKQKQLEAVLDVQLPNQTQRRTKILFTVPFDEGDKTDKAMLMLRKFILDDKKLVQMVEPILDWSAEHNDEKFASRLNEIKQKLKKVITDAVNKPI